MPMKNPPHPGRSIKDGCLDPLGLSITGGASARRKTLHVAGDTPELLKRLNEWIETRHV